jgi:acetyltransferase-like isoleucine patch superfamily enzyme
MTPRDVIRPLWQVVYRRYAVRANVSLGRRVHLGLGTMLWAPTRLQVGDDVYIGKGCTIECDGTIGSGVLVGNRVGIVGRRDHDMGVVGTPIRRAPQVRDSDGPHNDPVEIEDDVWIGYGAIVLSGVRVKRGAVVAAGAVVTKDVNEYEIVAGNPARVVGSRFDAADQVRHEQLISRSSMGKRDPLA